MTKYILILLTLACSTTLFANKNNKNTYTVGTGGDYKNIHLAIEDLKNNVEVRQINLILTEGVYEVQTLPQDLKYNIKLQSASGNKNEVVLIHSNSLPANFFTNNITVLQKSPVKFSISNVSNHELEEAFVLKH